MLFCIYSISTYSLLYSYSSLLCVIPSQIPLLYRDMLCYSALAHILQYLLYFIILYGLALHGIVLYHIL